MITVQQTHEDKVIKSSVSSGYTDYKYALENLFPLIDKFQEQRKIQSRSFYERLRKDIISGCIMPPLTIAFISDEKEIVLDKSKVEQFINKNIASGFILDGIQRLNTLNAASEDESFDFKRPIPLNIVIASNYDFLIYRMITLNNGQKPMTARHQVEMLTSGLIDYSELKNITVASEKDTQDKKYPKLTFKQGDIAEAYMAYLSENLHNSNSKIIQSKLDEIIVHKVMNSNISENKSSFQEFLTQIDRVCENEDAKSWLNLGNNLIGCAVAYRKSPVPFQQVTPKDFGDSCETFDQAFSSINTSRVNVGKIRRDLACNFVTYIQSYVGQDESYFVEKFNEITIS